MDDEVKKKQQRIGLLTGGIMLAIAFLFDLIQVPLTITVILPILIGWLAALIFGIWFKVLNVQYFQGKRAMLKVLALGAPILLSVIPLVNDLPDVTAGVALTLALVRLEDNEIIPPVKDLKQVAVEQRAVRQKQVLARQAVLRQQQQAAAAALPPEEEAA